MAFMFTSDANTVIIYPLTVIRDDSPIIRVPRDAATTMLLCHYRYTYFYSGTST